MLTYVENDLARARIVVREKKNAITVRRCLLIFHAYSHSLDVYFLHVMTPVMVIKIYVLCMLACIAVVCVCVSVSEREKRK